MEANLTFGLKDGKLKNILEVPNGGDCECICPNCGEGLIAVSNLESKVYKNVAHFRHESGVDCVGAYESALHLLAKEVLSKLKKLQLPNYHFDYDPSNKFSFEKSFQVLEFDACSLEQRMDFKDFYFIPDLIGHSQGKEMFIEFAYSHFVDFEKRKKIQKSKIACIEINIREMELDPEKLEKLFLSISEKIYWISNPKQDKIYLEKEKNRRLLSENEKHIKLEALKNGKVNTIQIINNKLWICPKKINFFKWYKSTKYYTHPILKEITDGEFWNGKFYGSYSTEEYIFLKQEKVYTSIHPYLGVDHDPDRLLLRKGLKLISERELLESRLCQYCAFDKGVFELENQTYQICSFKSEKGFIKDIF